MLSEWRHGSVLAGLQKCGYGRTCLYVIERDSPLPSPFMGGSEGPSGIRFERGVARLTTSSTFREMSTANSGPAQILN